MGLVIILSEPSLQSKIFPILIRWLGMIEPGIRKQPVGVEDVLPTLLELAQICETKQPEHLPFAGLSFRESLDRPTATDDRDIFRVAIGGLGVPVGEGANVPDMKSPNTLVCTRFYAMGNTSSITCRTVCVVCMIWKLTRPRKRT